MNFIGAGIASALFQDRDEIMVALGSRKARETRGTVGARSPTSEERHKADFYPTPAYATQGLIDVEDANGTPLPEYLWEPAAGDGAMLDVLRASGRRVYGTDLYDYGRPDILSGVDFLKQKRLFRDAAIVTNPPFKVAPAFAFKGLELGAERVCLLLRLAFLEGTRRAPLWPHLSRVWVFQKRLTIWKGDHERRGEDKGGMIAFAWFVFEPEPKRDAPSLGWIV